MLGDEVVISIEDIDVIKKMQVNYGGWNEAMKECLVGPCKLIQHDGLKAAVKAPSGRLYRLHSGLLSKYNKPTNSILPTAVRNADRKISCNITCDDESQSEFSIGDIVKVINDKNKVQALQKGHGEWNEFMSLIIEKKGMAKLIYPNGDLLVEIIDNLLRLNPECVMKVKSDKNDLCFTEMSLIIEDESVSHCIDTPLHVAVRNKNYDECRQLIADGVDVNALNKKKLTPIMVAAQIGYSDVLSLLVQHPDTKLDMGNCNNDTALHLAVQNSRVDAVRILLQKGADIKAINNKQFTPFHLAAQCGHEKILELCLNKYGKSLVDLKKGDNFASIHLAVIYNHTACLRLLIGHKADLNILNKNMQTALHIAVTQRHMDCVKILVENEAELDLLDRDGHTPLHNAIHLQNVDKMEERMTATEIINMFNFMEGLQRGTDEPEDIAIYLVEHGASLKILNSAGKSPLTACEDQSLREKLRKMQTESRQATPPTRYRHEVEEMRLKIEQLENEKVCTICCDNDINVTLDCGHRFCEVCTNKINECPNCRKKIDKKIRYY